MRVLVADDEPALRESLARSLRFEGYTVTTAIDGLAALAAVEHCQPDALVLDVVMPRLDGIEACRRLRAAGHHTPILVLTARDAVRDRVRGLNAGADDYLCKPFALEELLARLRSVVRRSGVSGAEPPMAVGDLQLDAASWVATRSGRELSLTRTEFQLLEMLVRHPGQVLTRSQLYEAVWGRDLDGSSNSLDVYIGYLRKKLGEPRMVHTVRGVGFALRPGDQS